MSKDGENNLSTKVYVGNLDRSSSKDELNDVFGKYGKLRSIWVARSPPGFAFVEFENRKDAEAAVKALDNTRCCGVWIRVDIYTKGGYGRRSDARFGTRGRGRRQYGVDRSRDYGRDRGRDYVRERGRDFERERGRESGRKRERDAGRERKRERARERSNSRPTYSPISRNRYSRNKRDSRDEMH